MNNTTGLNFFAGSVFLDGAGSSKVHEAFRQTIAALNEDEEGEKSYEINLSILFILIATYSRSDSAQRNAGRPRHAIQHGQLVRRLLEGLRRDDVQVSM